MATSRNADTAKVTQARDRDQWPLPEKVTQPRVRNQWPLLEMVTQPGVEDQWPLLDMVTQPRDEDPWPLLEMVTQPRAEDQWPLPETASRWRCWDSWGLSCSPCPIHEPMLPLEPSRASSTCRQKQSGLCDKLCDKLSCSCLSGTSSERRDFIFAFKPDFSWRARAWKMFMGLCFCL